MYRTIEVVFKNAVSTFELAKVDRKKLYGWKKRLYIDAQGRECAAARLTEDGRYILPSGATASLYVDKSGDVVDRSELVAIDPDGNPLETLPFDTNDISELDGPVAIDHFLEHAVTAAYQLNAIALCSELKSALSRGEIFCASFRKKADGQSGCSFLMMGCDGVFVVSAEHGDYNYIGYDEIATDSLEETDDETFDDLGFSVF